MPERLEPSHNAKFEMSKSKIQKKNLQTRVIEGIRRVFEIYQCRQVVGAESFSPVSESVGPVIPVAGWKLFCGYLRPAKHRYRWAALLRLALHRRRIANDRRGP